MKDMTIEEKISLLLAWIIEYNFTEDTKNGIGCCKAKVCIRDGYDELTSVVRGMSDEDKAEFVSHVVRLVANPCEDMEEDFRGSPGIDDGSFGYDVRLDDATESLAVLAVFRV